MSIPTAPLGRTGFELTRIGLGTWAIGGGGWQGGWGPQDDEASIRTIRRALEAGVNWIDTAAAYGLGHSEEVVAAALEGVPEADRPYIVTKCGLVWEPGGTTVTNVLAPESIRRECEDSLRRLRIEAIDLYLMHWPTWDGTPIEDSWATMAALVDEGKVRAIGLSNFLLDDLDACQGIRPVDAVQPELSLIERRAAEDRLPWAEANGAGVIVYSPMASGLLTGAFTLDSLAPDDWRLGHRNFVEPELSRNLALVDRLRELGRRLGRSVPELAVAWALGWPAVTAAIVGARAPEEVDGWARATDVALTQEELDEIAGAVVETGAGVGPSRPVMAPL